MSSVSVLGSAMLTGAIVILAQTVPSFAGIWALKARAASGPASEVVLRIEQDDTTLVQKLDTNALTFRLDGAETRNSMMSNSGVIDLTCTARWEGQKLVVHMASASQGDLTQILSLSGDGKELTVETIRINQNGEWRGTLTYRRQ